MAAPSGAPTVAEFAQKLQELRIDCGEPSYAAISRATRLDRESISVGSINTLLGGKRLTKAEIVRAFVRGVLRCRDGGEQPDHAEVANQWSALWSEVRLASKTEVGDANSSPPQADTPVGSTGGPDPRVSDAGFQDMPRSTSTRRPSRNSLTPPRVRAFRALLEDALSAVDDHGRKWADAKYGCYAFYDYDGEPIYVGQTNERLRTRVRRHLSNQRTDAVAMRILDVREVAELELWPLWAYEGVQGFNEAARAAKQHLNAVEYTIYVRSVEESRFKALLNERIPDVSEVVELPPSRRFQLIDDRTREESGHSSVLIARRAANLARLTEVALDRGEVSEGLRRVVVVQAARLTQLAASLHATASGLPETVVHIDGLDVLARPRPRVDTDDEDVPDFDLF